MDDADRAQYLQELQLSISIKKNNTKREIFPTGLCHNCYDKVDNNKLFCDINCSIDYERIKKIKKSAIYNQS